ncbi:hypothetical protein PEM_06895 [Stenotrophomonas sp. Pemsol]|nr:hypothetical protein PEM_06895 [Stenotrophomonas sp. Pemsol]PZS93439.1 hypothetical protein A7X90_13655 [Stenotrophomonas maltophilia]PZT15494.1 hypothetical protein A7X86_15410 [Stenotrophomonas maltophilia]PZT38533.1 hypothetical protein A7X99_11465 [Stenotrophomonas maltophilia]
MESIRCKNFIVRSERPKEISNILRIILESWILIDLINKYINLLKSSPYGQRTYFLQIEILSLPLFE